jgi:Rieske Fe-S protein
MENKSDHSFNRRQVISAMGWLLLLPFAGIWWSMIKRQQQHEETNIIKISRLNIPEGISYHGVCVMSKKNDILTVYSTRCSHLGCRLKLKGNGILSCPCHGSEFDPATGQALKGPAGKHLQILDYMVKDDFVKIEVK